MRHEFILLSVFFNHGMMQHELVAPWGMGQSQEQRSDSSRMRPGGPGMGQGWDGMSVYKLDHIVGQGCGREQPCHSIVGLGWTTLVWAEMEFHKDLEIHIFT